MEEPNEAQKRNLGKSYPGRIPGSLINYPPKQGVQYNQVPTFVKNPIINSRNQIIHNYNGT